MEKDSQYPPPTWNWARYPDWVARVEAEVEKIEQEYQGRVENDGC